MGENDNNINKSSSWWKPAVEIFSQVSGWIAAPIILALVVGKYLDTYFDTKPWIFLTLIATAFLISSFGIIRVVSKYMKKIEGSPDVKPGSRPESVGKNYEQNDRTNI